MYIHVAPGQEQTTLCGQNSDVNRKVLEKKIFENGGRWTTTDHGFTISSPMSLKAQVS